MLQEVPKVSVVLVNPTHVAVTLRYDAETMEAHIDGNAESELLNLSGWYDMISTRQWREKLAAGIDEHEFSRLRVNTHTGRPMGSDSFLSKCEKLIGRRVRPLPIGRPKKRKRTEKKR